MKALAQAVRAGRPVALGRALTLAENGGRDGEALMKELRPLVGNAKVIGLTGPPGAGKSTLVNALITDWRAQDRRVAVLAVDPVSPFSGGAVLGDRTRMGDHATDPDVFIRSVSARGHLGGVCAAASDMIDTMAAAGWELIIVETVGAGQSEVEIAELADATVVVCAPGAGDDVQAIKAGILEIGDILVVNKADRADADQLAKQLTSMIALRTDAQAREVAVLKTCAIDAAGVDALRAKLDAMVSNANTESRTRRLRRLQKVLGDRLARRVRDAVAREPAVSALARDLERGRLDMDEALAAAAAAIRQKVLG